MKPKLLIVELWGVGDLVIATPFIRAAAEKFSVTLLAKPFALDLQPRFWPEATVIPLDAPWTVFHGKYLVWNWPLSQMWKLRARLVSNQFDVGVSARWDPRDHLLLKLAEIPQRLGFPRAGSKQWLTHPLPQPEATAHHYEYWRVLGNQLGISLPVRDELSVPTRPPHGRVIIHCGARLSARVWPLKNFHELVKRLRASGLTVEVLCDADQKAWWQKVGEATEAPGSINELCDKLDRGDLFIGNCSGPGHLAAIMGLPTFTLFGPSLPEWFLPLHPLAGFIEGPACPFRPCSDYCHFSEPHCMTNLGVEETWSHLSLFIDKFRKSTKQTGSV